MDEKGPVPQGSQPWGSNSSLKVPKDRSPVLHHLCSEYPRVDLRSLVNYLHLVLHLMLVRSVPWDHWHGLYLMR